MGEVSHQLKHSLGKLPDSQSSSVCCFRLRSAAGSQLWCFPHTWVCSVESCNWESLCWGVKSLFLIIFLNGNFQTYIMKTVINPTDPLSNFNIY